MLGNARTVWIQRPVAQPCGVALFLDGEYYLAGIQAPETVERLQSEKRISPLLTAFVSHVGQPEPRWTESFCNPGFARFLAEELLPWLAREFAVATLEETVFAGLSLTGLSAAHAALHYPRLFPRVLCQSGSFWWNDGWLIAEVAGASGGGVSFRMTVGEEETAGNVDHGSGLVQRESQRSGCRRLRDVLQAAGYPVSYREFPGGHDVASWRADLPGSLASLFDDR